jgi:hypothetical protein
MQLVPPGAAEYALLLGERMSQNSIKSFATRALPTVTLLGVIAMLSSLISWFFYPRSGGWLDRFFIGGWHHNLGFDYFSVPRSFINLVHGHSIYHTSIYSYAPWATWYFYHPALAIFVGSWTSLFYPWVSYAAFVGFSLVLLVLSAWLIARQTGGLLIKRLSYFCILCAFPTYLLLWNAQMHVFTVIAVACILAGVLAMAQPAPDAQKNGQWLVALGLLISLFSKPIVFLCLPALLCAKETRKTTLQVLGVYAIVSIIFLLTPVLNPEHADPMNGNALHWVNILQQSGKIDVSNPECFSLPAFLMQILPQIPLFLFKIPLLFLLGSAGLLLFVPTREERLSLLVLAILLAVYNYYLSYTIVWEYHYTTLLPTIPFLLILLQRDRHPRGRRLLRAMLAFAVLFYLPTLYFLFRQHPAEHIVLVRIMRVLPVTMIYILLITYLLQWWKARRDILRTMPVLANASQIQSEILSAIY